MKPQAPVPADLALLAEEFASWRANRPHLRSPFPPDLLARAALAAGVHAIGTVARALGVDRRKLDAVLENGGACPKTPARAAPMVVRLAEVVGVNASATAVVEITDPSGWRCRVSGSDIAAAVRAFVEARR